MVLVLMILVLMVVVQTLGPHALITNGLIYHPHLAR